MATLLPGEPEDIRLLAEWLHADGVVAVPTETVYGLAGNARSSDACRKIFRVKGRPYWDPLIVHVGSQQMAEEIVEWNEEAQRLAQAFWPGPLTLILQGRGLVAQEVTAGHTTVAVRMPDHPLFLALLEKSGLPLAAPSANPFGYLSPTCAEDVQRTLGDRLEYILDGGPCRVGVESTIVDLSRADPVILRPGALGAEALSKVLSRPVLNGWNEAVVERSQAPGLAAWHYSPVKPLRLWDSTREPIPPCQEGERVLLTATPMGGEGKGTSLFTGLQSDIQQVARNLYHALLEADCDPDCKSIVVELPVGNGALQDALIQRLKKAAARY